MKRVRPTRVLGPLAVALATGTATLVSLAPPAAAEVRPIRFPVDGAVHYTDTFGAARSGHSHKGTDIMGTKLEHLLAARDGFVTKVSITSSGNYFIVTDGEGWEYWYLHVNNDSPGTDDGSNPTEWIMAPGIHQGSAVKAGELVGYLGDSGNAEGAGAHLHFEIHRPGGAIINPYDSLNAATKGGLLPTPGAPSPKAPEPPKPAKPVPPPPPPQGRWLLRDGLFGGPADVTFKFAAPTDQPLVCDGNGDSTDTAGVARPGSVDLIDENTPGLPDTTVAYGAAGDQFLCGDWNGDGTDTIGIYRNGTFELRNQNTAVAAEITVPMGMAGDTPLSGDWDGDGVDTVGIYRAGLFYLDNSLDGSGPEPAFAFGPEGATPLVGDWDGNGRDSVGAFQAGRWSLRNTNSAGPADATFDYGTGTDRPLVGDFNGDHVDTVGVFRGKA